eukprot:Skav208576  [mRNA]  locus=scaffold177:258004:260176:+ [translate_table: standard]
MSKTSSSRLRRVAAIFAAMLSCLLPPSKAFTSRSTLVTSSPSSPVSILNGETLSDNAHFSLTGRQASAKAVAPRGFGGKHSEALFTALVAGLSTYAMSTIGFLLRRQLWVPPFGAVTLIFAADAVAAAKEGKTMDFKVMKQKALQACIGVAGACFLTVILARVLGDTPGILRGTAMAVAAFSMYANPSSGYFPPAGALCALYVEKAVSTGVTAPQYSYALFPCATGVALLLLLCRSITFVAHPFWHLFWPFSAKHSQKEVMAQP